MANIADYIGKPYSFMNFNCWDCVALVRKDFGIKTTMFQPKTLTAAFELITAQMATLGGGLSLVDKPQNFDVVFVEGVTKGKKSYHCGAYHDGNVLHCCAIFGSVRYESLADFSGKYTKVTFWR